MYKKVLTYISLIFVLLVFAGCAINENKNPAAQKIAGEVNVKIVGYEDDVIFENGDFSETGADKTYISEGDSVLWFYSTDFLKDLSF